MRLIKTNRLREAVNLFREGFGQYKIQILILVVLGFVSGLFEAIGINAVIPLFSFAAGGGESGTDLISRSIIGFLEFLNLSVSIQYLLIFILLMFVLKALSVIVFNYIQIKISADYEYQSRQKLFGETLSAGWPYLMEQKIGYLEKVLMNDIGHNTYLLRYLSQVILLITSLVMYTLVALNISLIITLFTFLLGFIVLLFFKRFVYKTRKISQKYEILSKEVAHHVNENMIGIKTVKATNAERAVVREGRNYFERLMNLRIKNFVLQAISGELIEPIGLIFIVGVFAFSYRQPEFNFASFAVIIFLIHRIFGYLQNAQMKLHSINEFIPYLQRVVSFGKTARENQENITGKKDFKFNNEIEFDKVSFSYKTSKEILNDINFTVKKGEMVGLIGPSGSGKTTIVDLFLRLLEPSAGKILLDGTDVSEIDVARWRANIGYVSQDIFLLNDSIENNIRFYDKSLGKKQISEASKMANIYEFIQNQPQGFATMVGERGVALSGGQKQRIILARVLARNPQILVLDEATSALDSESERQVQKAIENLRGKITVLVIAHRLSTVAGLDRLIALDSGKIIEQGSPQDLLQSKDSYFSKLYHLKNAEVKP